MDLFTGKNKATLQNIGEVGEQVDALSRRTEEAASALARFRIEDH